MPPLRKIKVRISSGGKICINAGTNGAQAALAAQWESPARQCREAESGMSPSPVRDGT